MSVLSLLWAIVAIAWVGAMVGLVSCARDIYGDRRAARKIVSEREVEDRRTSIATLEADVRVPLEVLIQRAEDQAIADNLGIPLPPNYDSHIFRLAEGRGDRWTCQHGDLAGGPGSPVACASCGVHVSGPQG